MACFAKSWSVYWRLRLLSGLEEEKQIPPFDYAQGRLFGNDNKESND